MGVLGTTCCQSPSDQHRDEGATRLCPDVGRVQKATHQRAREQHCTPRGTVQVLSPQYDGVLTLTETFLSIHKRRADIFCALHIAQVDHEVA